MSSNYNYNYALAHLNSLNPVIVPELSDEEIARELELWSNNQFIEVPPGMSLLEVDQNVTQSTMMELPLTEQTQTQQNMPYIQFFQNPLPITIATSPTDNLAPIFTPPIISVAVSNAVKEAQENAPSTTPSTNITTDPTPTVATKATTKSTTKSATANSTATSSNRKSTKSSQPSTSETTQSGSETKEGEKDADLAAKLAAEEDKRRRNTAASARFRVKKKMREQALERTAREMTNKAEIYEGRVKELEMEIKWLRNLIVEKDAGLLDVERPGKRRKKGQSEDDDDNDDEDDDKKEKGVKQEQSEQTNKKE